MSAPVPPWQHRAERRREPKQPLNVDSIVVAAMDLLDGEGLDAVSMRRVAQKLGTGAASLYAHVRNKDELHALVLDAVIGEVAVPEPEPGRWQEQIKDFAREQLRVFVGHPGIAQVVLRNPAPTGPHALRVTEALLGLLRGAGLPEQVVAWALDLISLYVTAVAMERSAFFGRPEADMAERMAQVGQYFAQLPEQSFPHILAMRVALMEGDADERFEFGLQVLVQGLASFRE